MDNILEMRRKENSGEEILAGYTPEFPYVSSRTFVSRYDVLWHWHKSVELFYIEEGTLEYETPQGRVICPAGTGGLVNAGVLHTTRPQESHTVQLLHIFNPVLLSGQREGLIYQKYFSPILSAPQIELLPITRDHVDTLEKLRASFRIPPCAPAYELQLRESLTSIWLDLLPLLPSGLEPGRTVQRKDQGDDALCLGTLPGGHPDGGCCCRGICLPAGVLPFISSVSPHDPGRVYPVLPSACCVQDAGGGKRDDHRNQPRLRLWHQQLFGKGLSGQPGHNAHRIPPHMAESYQLTAEGR